MNALVVHKIGETTRTEVYRAVNMRVPMFAVHIPIDAMMGNVISHSLFTEEQEMPVIVADVVLIRQAIR